jgi:hypothetical protein
MVGSLRKGLHEKDENPNIANVQWWVGSREIFM